MSTGAAVKSKGFRVPAEFFTLGSFGTVGGAASAVWLVTGVVSDVFGVEPMYVGFAVSIAITFLVFLGTRERRREQLLLLPFNACLIYALAVGVTSFSPYINKGTSEAAEPGTESPTALLRPWIPDRNLVASYRETDAELSTTLGVLQTINEDIRAALVAAEPQVMDNRVLLGKLNRVQNLVKVRTERIKALDSPPDIRRR